jgi:hypothetical protein
METKEDRLSREYAAAFDRKGKRVNKGRWNAGTIRKIKLPANWPTRHAELQMLETGLADLRRYWQQVATEAPTGVYVAITY